MITLSPLASPEGLAKDVETNSLLEEYHNGV